MSKQPFGGQKNPPWARSNTAQQQQPLSNLQGGTILGNMSQQNILQYQQPQQVFAQNLGIQQSNLQQLQAQGLSAQINQGQIYPLMATVAYPNPRNINNQAFQTVSVATNNTAVPSTKQRVFTGTVTKIHNDFGFVDEDVFFQTTACVKGSNPVMGDRVLVEASYNPSMPFKWNATRIQVLPVNNGSNNRRDNPPPHKGFSQSGKQQVQPINKYNAVPPPDLPQNGGNFGGNSNNSSRSNMRKNNNPPRRSEKDRKDKDDRHRDTEAEEAERKKRREERERERIARDKEREDKEKRSPSRRRSRSPKNRRRARPVPRYMVQIPKIALDMPDADVLEVTRRYSNLYIPSDFFKTHMTWVEAFPPDVPFTLTRPCSFHVMHKDVEPISSPNDIQEPSDADYLFSAKVMLMSMPAMDEVYRKCCSLADENDNGSDDTTFVHPTRLINFLVGLRGKNETMAIGGPWSPSLDGPNPEKNPSVLIKTAIRTCKSLTGIDLSNCTQWYRFVELYYRRSVSTHKGRQVSARVETVVIFLPDVWSCLPTRLEWDSLHDGYRQQLNSRDVAGKELDTKDSDDAALNANIITDDQADVSSGEPKREPTHFSELDPKTMKVQDLRIELEARNINSKGLKSQLIARLVKAMKAEADKVDREDEEENEAMLAKEANDSLELRLAEIDEKDKDEDRKKKHDESRKSDDKERALLEKRYTLPEAPHIIAHPSKVAKSGKFDCTVMSLSLLLDYRPEDTKEHSFEVSLFAELFNEMLMRDFGFNIYKSLYVQPEKPKEEPKKDTKSSESTKKCDDLKKSDGDKKDNDSKKSEKSEKSDRDDHRGDNNEDDGEDDDDNNKSDGKNRSKGVKKPKMVTKDPNLLLSFVYFDQTHCGYIFEKDVEELLYTLGLNLSRAQVRKLVTKVVSRNSLHYRKLTDKPKEDHSSKPMDTTTEPRNEAIETKSDDKCLAFGNKRFLPVFENINQDESLSKKRKLEDDASEDQTNKDGFVMYKGGLLDIEKLMAQMARLEKARADTEVHLVETKQKNNELMQENSKASSSIRELTDKLSDYRSKLSVSEKEVKELSVKSETYHTLVRTIQCTINNAMEKVLKNEERGSKSDDKSSRGKSREKYDKYDDRSSKSESRYNKSEEKSSKSDDTNKSHERSSKSEVKFEEKLMKSDDKNEKSVEKTEKSDVKGISFVNKVIKSEENFKSDDKTEAKIEKPEESDDNGKSDDKPEEEIVLKMEVDEVTEKHETVDAKNENDCVS